MRECNGYIVEDILITYLMRGGGYLFLLIINGTLLFLRKLIGGSYEKIIRFYFLYEILKESIFFKKISYIYGKNCI